MTKITYRRIPVDGIEIFYREAGSPDAPVLLLLHGFPTASHMFRDLIPQLADRFHVVAPDLPGFGQSAMPDRSTFSYTFDNIAKVIDRFTEVIGLRHFAIYVFDYGAPTGFRLAMWHPERITAIVSQNGNAYVEGLSDGWNPIRAYWQDPSPANRTALRAFLSPETTRWQYTHGVAEHIPRFHRTDIRSIISTWHDLARTRCSSISSATTRATSRCIPNSKPTSASTRRHFWRCGEATTRSSCRLVPRRSSATFPTLTCTSSTPVTSPWRRTATRSPRRSASSLDHFKWTEEIRRTDSSTELTKRKLSTCLLVP